LVNNELTTGLEEDAQLDLKVNNVGLQAKFKPNLISLHADFGQHLRQSVKDGKVCNVWFNPYLLWETNRALTNNKLNFGFLTHVNSSVKNHVSLKVPGNLGKQGKQLD
jgi:hypothetical protein